MNTKKNLFFTTTFSSVKAVKSLFLSLIFLLLGVQVWGQGTEDFAGIASTTSYGTRTWTGTNGTSWTATDAREDQTITSKAITIRNGSLTFGLTNAQKSSGIGDLSLKAKAPFGSPDVGSLQLIVNGTVVSAKNTTGATTSTVVTYTWSAINVGTITSIEIKQNTSGSRITIDDVSWTAYSSGFTVTYSGNANTSGNVPTDATGYASNASVTVKGNTGSPILAKTGYTFADWNTLANGTGTPRAVASTFSITANTTLYAQWTGKVIYDANTGTGTVPTDANNYLPAAPVNTAANTLTKTGYTFGGWNTAANGTGTNYAQSTTNAFAFAGNVTLYAKWVSNDPAITASTSSLAAFSTTYGTASANNTFTVSGSNLTNDLIVTAPSGFEVSLTSGGTYTASVSLTPTAGTVSATNIYIRIAAATAVGSYNGNISLESAGATPVNIAIVSSTVNKKGLTITGLSATNKEYDRTTGVTVSGTPAYVGLVNNETFTVTGTVTWAFADFNIGNNKPLTRTGTYDTPSGNYTLTQPAVTASITAKALAVSGAVAQNKAYNGNTAATITGAVLVGVISGDVVTVSGGGIFANANVGTAKPVTPNLVISGTDAGNYTITQPTGLTADITPIAPTFTTSAINFNTGGTYALPGASVSSNSAGAFSYSLGTASPAGSITLTGSTLNGIAAGNVTLTVNQAASGNYTSGSTTVPVNVTTASNTTDHFRSRVTTGNWAAIGSWESSSDNITWSNATLAPTSSASTITIVNGNSITVAATATGKNITVDAGGVLILTATLTVSDGTGTDLQINGTMNLNASGVLTNNGTAAFGSTGIYNHNRTGGAIPIASWNDSSTCNIVGSTSALPTNYAQTYGNFTWYGASQSSNLTINNSAFRVNGLFRLLDSSGYTFTMGGTTVGTYANTLNSASIEGGILAIAYTNGVTSTTTVTNDMSISGNAEVRINGSAGVGTLNVGRDLLISGSGYLNLLYATTSPSTTLTIARDFILSGNSRVDLELLNSASGSAVIKVGRNFNSTSSGDSTSEVTVDFGNAASGTVSGNAINIAGNFSSTGSGSIQTFSSNSPTGFVFDGSGIQTFAYTTDSAVLNWVPITINSGSTLQLQNDFIIGQSTTAPAAIINVNGTLDFQNYTITAGTSTVPRINTSAGANFITTNTGGIGGTGTTGSLQNFGSVSATSAAGRVQLIAGLNYTFNGATTTPFNVNMGNPAIVNINANVIDNIIGSATTITGALNVNAGATFALNSAAGSNLNLSNANGSLNIAAGGTFDNGGENIVTSSGGNPTVNINGTFITRDAQGFTGTNTAIPGITPTLGNNSTIVYGLNGNQMVTNFASGYRNLTFSGSGTKTTGTISSITGTVTINSGVTVDAGNRGFGGADTNLTMLPSSVFKTGGSGTKPDPRGTYNLSNTSTIEFGGTASTTILVEPIYGNININTSTVGSDVGEVSLSGNTTSLTLQDGSAFTVKSGGIFNVRNTNGLSGASNTAINNTNNPNVVLDPGSIINYNGAAAQTVTASPNYSNLIISGSGVKTASAALTVNDKLNIDAGTLSLKSGSGNDLNLGGVMTIASGAIFDNNGENQILGSGSIVNNGTFITRDAQGFSETNAAVPAITSITMGSGSTVHYALEGNQDVSARSDYHNLLFTGNGTKTVLANTMPIEGTVRINDSNTVVDASDKTFGSNATNLTMAAGTLRVAGAGLKPDFGGIYDLSAGTTVDFYGSEVAQIRLTPAYANVRVSGTNVTTDLSQSSAGINFISGGNFTVKSGAEFDVHNTAGLSGSGLAAINLAAQAITLEAGSTIDYNGVDQTITTALNYPNLKVSAAGTKSSSGNVIVDNLTTVSAGTLKMLKTSDTVDANVLYAHKGINNTGGEVIFENNAQLMQDADAENHNNIQSQRDVVDMNNITGQMDYVYWSSPVSGQAIKAFSPNSSAAGYLQYNESNDKFVITADTNFQTGKGYAIRAESGFSNPYAATYKFTGIPNNGDQKFLNLKYTNSTHGYNLVGNPYPSNIDFTLLYMLNSTKIYSTAFFWTNNSYSSSQVGSNYNGNNYAVFNGSGGTPATYNPTNPYNGSLTPNGKIKVGQAFIVQAKITGKDQSLDYNNSIRVTDKGTFFQKTDSPKNRFWLEMVSPNNLVNTILVGYIPGASNNYETDFDGELFVVGSDSFYSILGAKKLAIQGKANNFTTEDVVPLGNVYSATGNYKIKLKDPEGIFANNQSVYLRDKLLNKYISLTDVQSYTFTGTKGTDNTRFEIVYKENAVLGTGNDSKSDFIVYKDGNDFVIKSSKILGKIEVIDASGRLMKTLICNQSAVKIDMSAFHNGIYVLKIENSGDIRTKKINR